MRRRSVIRSRVGIVVVILIAAIGGIAATTPPAPVPVPTAKAFTSFLDLECFKTNPYTPPLTAPIVLSHLNPVLAGLPRWPVTLGTRTQLCAPVAKNGNIPPPGVLDYVRFVDLSCYQITGPSPNFTLTISHLNPLLSHLPRKVLTMLVPEQLCVPVIKNESVPPPEVLNLVRYIDLACFRTSPPTPLGINLTLTQLNPVLTGIPPTTVSVREDRQLCVPVRKGNQEIPPDVQRIVQWIDLEKYDIIAPALTPITLTLRHINPLLSGLPAETATLTGRQQLALPVAKNNVLPPG